MARVISVVSGKKGVGSSTVAINLALCIAAHGYRTCILLTDPQFYESNLSLNRDSEDELTAVIEKKRTVEDVVIRQYHGIDILLGGSMFKTAQSLNESQIQYFMHSFESMAGYDFFIIDAIPGNSRLTLSVCIAATDIILVMTPESSSITSAHSLVKTLGQNGFTGSMSVVVNQSKNVKISAMAINKLNDSLQKSFHIHLESLGDITKDSLVSKSTDNPTPHVIRFPESTVARDIQKIALTLTNMETSASPFSGPDLFWERFFNLISADAEDFTAVAASMVRTGDPLAIEIDEKEKSAMGLKPILTGDQPEKSDFNHAVPGDFQALLERLSDSIASLSREIRGLRVTLERQSNSQTPDFSSIPAATPSKITLDFESFLSQRMK